MYYAIGMSAPSLHRESTDSLIIGTRRKIYIIIHVYIYLDVDKEAFHWSEWCVDGQMKFEPFQQQQLYTTF